MLYFALQTNRAIILSANTSSLEIQLYGLMYKIRRFEETVLDNFPKGVFFGTTHTYIGQEANAVGVLHDLQTQDIVFSNHRCHGHFLAYGGNLRALFGELMGKASGVCGGRGGSQHLQWRNFYSNGVQGGIVPVATGMAVAEKIKNSDALSIAFLGDGTLGEGVIYEAFNLAVLWHAPILYVVENNRIAQTTPSQAALAGDIFGRFSAFGIPGCTLDTSDVVEISQVAGQLFSEIRSQGGPHVLILNTFRFGPHSKGDDTRPAQVIEQMRAMHDPLTILAARLNTAERTAVETQIDFEVQQAYQAALSDPLAAPDDIFPGG